MPGYDTLNLSLLKEQVNNTDLLAKIPMLLTNLKESHCHLTGVTSILGSLRNMRVMVKSTGVYTTGSICKYFLNDNVQTLNLKQTKDAIAMLSDELHLSMFQANVKRIDIAENFVMDFTASHYLPFLGRLGRYNRLEQEHGINYRIDKREMLFYDKLHEMKSKHLAIPEMLQMQNLLRYEFRFKNRLCEQFNLPELKADLIYTERFYKEISTRWEKEYFKIPKIKIPNFNMTIIRNVKEFEKQIFLKGIESLGGELAMMQRIEQAKKQDIFKNKMQVNRIKHKVKNLCSTSLLTFESDAIIELDRKVKEAANKSH